MVPKGKLMEISKACKMTLSQLKECIQDALRFLGEQRAKRPRPHLDNKIITGWNALAISGFCAAAQAMPQRTEFRASAERAVKFIKENLVLNNELLRSAYVSEDGNIEQM